MRHIRVTARIDPAVAPPFFDQLANRPGIRETRLLDWNLGGDGPGTVLYGIDGDPGPFAAGATEHRGIESVEISETEGQWTYALVVMRPLELPVFEAIHRATARSGLVVRTPIVYRDSAIAAHAVGDPEPLQRALDDAPDAMDVTVETIGRARGRVDDPWAVVSERQRAAVEVALDLGYYDQPRRATHEEVAAELGCAPATASDHLQKAEAKLVAATVGQFQSLE